MNAYKTVCKLGFYDFNVDMWCFSIFCRNLVARGETVGHFCYEHIEWENDCLVIKFPKTKNDQTVPLVMDRSMFTVTNSIICVNTRLERSLSVQ